MAFILFIATKNTYAKIYSSWPSERIPLQTYLVAKSLNSCICIALSETFTLPSSRYIRSFIPNTIYIYIKLRNEYASIIPLKLPPGNKPLLCISCMRTCSHRNDNMYSYKTFLDTYYLLYRQILHSYR